MPCHAVPRDVSSGPGGFNPSSQPLYPKVGARSAEGPSSEMVTAKAGRE